MKKLLTITLCLLITLTSLVVCLPTAYADTATDKGTVTVHKKIEGTGQATDKTGLNGSEFSFYQVFALENGVYNISANFQSNSKMNEYKQSLIQKQGSMGTNGGYVTYGTTTELEAIATDLAAFAKTKTAYKVVTSSGKLNASGVLTDTDFTDNTLTAEEKANGVKIAGVASAELPYGVYLVIETKPTEGYVESTRPFFVSVSSQTLTDGNIDVYPKNEKPAAVKKIGSSADEDAAVMNGVYAIGENIPYFIKTKTPNYDTKVLDYMITNSSEAYNALTFTLADTFSKGLSLVLGEGADNAAKVKAAFTVKIGGTTFDSFTVAEKANNDGTKTYTITIPVKDLYSNNGTVNLLNSDVTVDYNAVLNQDAVVGINDNEVTVEYNRDPQNTEDKISMTPPKPEVYTYELDLTKLLNGNAFTGNDEATFTLTKVAEWNNDGTENDITDVSIKAEGSNGAYNVSKETAATADLTTKNGKFTLKGLSEGIYELAETDGVEDYAMLTSPVRIYVKKTVVDGVVTPVVEAYIYKNGAQYSLTKTEGNRGIFYVEVNNPKSQFILPMTGASGVVLIVLGGATVLAAAVAVFLIALKKKSK